MSIKQIKVPVTEKYTLKNITVCDTCGEEMICEPYSIECGYGSPSDMSIFHYCSTNCFFEGAKDLYLHDSHSQEILELFQKSKNGKSIENRRNYDH